MKLILPEHHIECFEPKQAYSQLSQMQHWQMELSMFVLL